MDTPRLVRILAALAAFAIVAVAGVVAFGRFGGEPDPVTFAFQASADSLALVLAVALAAALIVYVGVEYLQTGAIASVAGQFDTRTVVLMPVAIALNILMGTVVVTTLKVPIYLDSIGTILVAVLAGPVPGMLTGFVSNVLWAYVVPPPFQYPPAAAFAIVAALIGGTAGLAARVGVMRPRPDQPTGALVVGGLVTLGVIAGIGALAFVGYRAILGEPALLPAGDPFFVVLAWAALAAVLLAAVGLLVLLFVRRDLGAAYVVVGGLVTGILAALVSAPIAAGVFGGVTGAGTDFLVAAFRQAGADIGAATLGQGLISDPIDKITTFFLVYLVLNAMSRRTKARFPQGERLVPREAL